MLPGTRRRQWRVIVRGGVADFDCGRSVSGWRHYVGILGRVAIGQAVALRRRQRLRRVGVGGDVLRHRARRGVGARRAAHDHVDGVSCVGHDWLLRVGAPHASSLCADAGVTGPAPPAVAAVSEASARLQHPTTHCASEPYGDAACAGALWRCCETADGCVCADEWRRRRNGLVAPTRQCRMPKREPIATVTAPSARGTRGPHEQLKSPVETPQHAPDGVGAWSRFVVRATQLRGWVRRRQQLTRSCGVSLSNRREIALGSGVSM